MGGQAHNDTVTYIYETLTALGDYYDVTLQPWSSVVQVSGEASLAIDGTNITEATLMEYSASGDVSAPLVPVSNFGCDQVCIDFASNFHPKRRKEEVKERKHQKANMLIPIVRLPL